MMKRFLIPLAIAAFAVGFAAVVAPQPSVAAAGGARIDCADPQPGKGKSKCLFTPPPCTTCVCIGKCEWECTPIPGCVP